MLAGVIFDVDGTLLDSMPIWGQAPVLYLKQFGIEADQGLADRVFSLSQAEWARYIRDNYQLEQTDLEVQEGICRITDDFYLNQAALKPGVFDLIEALGRRHIPMIAATNTPRVIIDQVLSRHQIRHHFIDILNCSDLGTSKREPLIYLKALEILGTPKEGTWIFEDVEHAAATARKAGFPLVCVADEASRRQREEIIRLADFFFDDLTDLNLDDLISFHR